MYDLQAAQNSYLAQALPMVRHALSDVNVQIIRRAMDASWGYETEIPQLNPGFNPFINKLFVASHSEVDNWLNHPTQDLRDLNEGDHLLKEALFLAHDYVHIWATRRIQTLCPEIGFGVGEVLPERLESYIFCQLIAEVAATIAIDYWYLARMDLEAVVPIGSTLTFLTTTYHQKYEDDRWLLKK